MAVTAIATENNVLNTPNLAALVMTAPTVAADGFTVDFTGRDGKILLAFSNTGAVVRTFTVKAGNALQGVADLVSGNIAAGAFGTLVIESGKYKNVSGTNKGKVLIIPAHAELKMAAVLLP